MGRTHRLVFTFALPPKHIIPNKVSIRHCKMADPKQQKLQIYSTPSLISPFWRDKYEREAKRYWDIFYKRHQDKFFKDRHYLDKEWGHYFNGEGRTVVLEVGCGAGNTIFPLIATSPNIFVHACDFSPRAVDLVKKHKDYNEACVHAFTCDLTADDLSDEISPSSVDIVTMIFVLSAVSPEKMALVLQNIKKVLKPNGYVLLRDYALGDLAQERFSYKDQKIGENFYVRGDGTRAFYFSNEFLTSLFEDNGFSVEDLGVYCKQFENRSREIVMNRRWIQAVFRYSENSNCAFKKEAKVEEGLCQDSSATKIDQRKSNEPLQDSEVDISEGLGHEMFGISPSNEKEVIEIKLRDKIFKITLLPKEYQHTCKSTGLMLWESAHMMASVLARNPTIVEGKKVLELGSGCSGICSMVAARSAKLVVATDGDAKALDMLTSNIDLNLGSRSQTKLVVKRLEWGNSEHIKAIKKLSSGGFEVIIGTDITYICEAISPLLMTAKELISCKRKSGEEQEPALILCHIVRRVDEPSILSAASECGFRLVERWPLGNLSNLSESIIAPWFPYDASEDYIPNGAPRIMYFCLQ